jgi:SAM-dependent methyltransferase
MQATRDKILAFWGRNTTRIYTHLHRLRFNWMYLGKPPWDTGITPPELEDFIRRHPPGRAVDLGCGTGTNLCALGRAGWQVVGVEFVPRAARAARQKLRQNNIAGEVRIGDASSLEVVQGSYDLVLDIGCYHGLPENSRASYRENLGTIMKPAGYFLLYAHWQSAEAKGPVGITDSEADAFQKILTLYHRQDSLDRWGRQASWFWFQKP